MDSKSSPTTKSIQKQSGLHFVVLVGSDEWPSESVIVGAVLRIIKMVLFVVFV